MDVVVTVVVSTLITVVVLVLAGWTGGRPRLRGEHQDRSGRGGGDPWHGDPRPEVVDRPAGADAEAGAAEVPRQKSARRADDRLGGGEGPRFIGSGWPALDAGSAESPG